MMRSSQPTAERKAVLPAAAGTTAARTNKEQSGKTAPTSRQCSWSARADVRQRTYPQRYKFQATIANESTTFTTMQQQILYVVA